VSAFDPRLTLTTGDVAAAGLEGIVPAASYLPTATLHVVAPTLGLHRSPSRSAELDDQLLFGERFEVLETRGEWAFGQAARDGYTGWAERAGLSQGLTSPSHWVRAVTACALTEPHFKAPPRAHLATNALVSVEARENGFAKAAGLGWIAETQLAPLGKWEQDPSAVAERCLGAPYLWSGRTAAGIDCSGLVQQALYACGLACPRDSDMQAALGAPLSLEDGDLRRNDLVFWRGHVGIMLDQARLLHATSHVMAVTIEPLAEVRARKGPPSAVRRLELWRG
jgi:cell wall-associated NlpC family hydrolase